MEKLWNEGSTAGSSDGLQYPSLKQIFRNATDLNTAYSLLKNKPPGISQAQFDIVKGYILNENSIIEYVPVNQGHGGPIVQGLGYMMVVSVIQHPLSRGSIHIVSADPLKPPSIDPKYLSVEFDRWLLSKTIEFLRSIFLQQPFQNVLLSETQPGNTVNTFTNYLSFTQQTADTEYHPIGTASLLPEIDGGVVSPEAIVYGTSNVMVADASIIPLHIAGHTANIAFALAEKIDCGYCEI